MLNTRSLTAVAVAVAFLASLVCSGPESWAQGRGLALIRDAEIEHTIRLFATPAFQAAGLDLGSVQIHIVNDSSINAFVAAGQNVFINTGLIIRTENPNQLIGVIAHETGHIAGGHLARGEEAMRTAFYESILSMVLGAAAIVAGGGNAGSAIFAGGQQVAQRSFLQFSRTQESQADQAGVTFLTQSGQSGKGLLEFLQILQGQEALLSDRQDPYVLTHPLSRERIEALRNRVEQSPFFNRASPPEYVEMHKRMRAKLIGFLQPLGQVLRQYPETDQSLPARYARAIAYYRVPEFNKAIAELDSLLKDRPDDPYFLELKGQILLENGHVAESVPVYEASVKAAPNEPLIRYALGQAQLSTEDAALTKTAIANLEQAVREDPDNPGAWYQLSVGYGRENNLGMAHLASAERAMLIGRPLDAKQQAERALSRLPVGSPAALRADDIVATASRRLKDQRR